MLEPAGERLQQWRLGRNLSSCELVAHREARKEPVNLRPARRPVPRPLALQAVAPAQAGGDRAAGAAGQGPDYRWVRWARAVLLQGASGRLAGPLLTAVPPGCRRDAPCSQRAPTLMKCSAPAFVRTRLALPTDQRAAHPMCCRECAAEGGEDGAGGPDRDPQRQAVHERVWGHARPGGERPCCCCPSWPGGGAAHVLCCARPRPPLVAQPVACPSAMCNCPVRTHLPIVGGLLCGATPPSSGAGHPPARCSCSSSCHPDQPE